MPTIWAPRDRPRWPGLTPEAPGAHKYDGLQWAPPNEIAVKSEVSGEVTGEAQVRVDTQLRVDPSPLLIATIEKSIGDASNMRLAGKLGKSFTGTNGAIPVPIGVPSKTLPTFAQGMR